MGDAEGDMDLINEPITKDEVTRALISLKNGKVPGPDGIIGEMLKNASDVVLDSFLGGLYYSIKYLIKEYILKTGQTQSFTLYTKKETQMIKIITGVFLSDVSRKLFSIIISLRLQMWVDMNDVIGEQQARFSLKDYSTVDQIFTLLAIVQK